MDFRYSSLSSAGVSQQCDSLTGNLADDYAGSDDPEDSDDELLNAVEDLTKDALVFKSQGIVP
jgi:hypothetical protein